MSETTSNQQNPKCCKSIEVYRTMVQSFIDRVSNKLIVLKF